MAAEFGSRWSSGAGFVVWKAVLREKVKSSSFSTKSATCRKECLSQSCTNAAARLALQRRAVATYVRRWIGELLVLRFSVATTSSRPLWQPRSSRANSHFWHISLAAELFRPEHSVICQVLRYLCCACCGSAGSTNYFSR